jgi:hypothetical protein
MDKKRKGRKMPFSYLFPRGIKWQRKSAAGFSPHRVGDADKGDILFLEREYPPYTPKRKDEGPSPLTPHIGSFYLEELHALRNRARCTWLRHESSASRFRLQPRLTTVMRE